MDTQAEVELKSKLEPFNVQQTLVKASCFLSAYELIKAEVIGGVHDFYWSGIDNSKFTYDERAYSHDVLSLDKNKFKASCKWLIKSDALTDQDVQVLERVYDHRHEVAHELPKLLVDPAFEVNTSLLLDASECLRKLGIFWATIDIETGGEWDVDKIDFEGIKSGSYALMEYLLSIAGVKAKRT
jgi:hypothetical protein